ncbi:MAG TPA: hypothetical protein PK668_20690 [Myxococcota bacterium]|nr:hypothetical protein [Myxococcota bacterium]HRY96249.1 hypothetical protein [Myxococcota bacterium]
MRFMRVLSKFGLSLAWVFFLGLAGCDSGSTNPPVDGGDGEDATDGADLDGQDGQDGVDEVDGADGADGTDGGPTAGGPTRFSITSGGGEAGSANFKVRLNVGAPQPYGSASGPNGAVEAGPGARP